MSDIISVMGVIYEFLLDQFSNVLSVITSNPILFLPVLIALFGSIVFFVVRLIRRLGVRGHHG